MMDDFGCGYSSLNMLKNIPVDVLKLDMRFLQFKEEERQKSANILEAIINMAGLLHLPIVVEGVENESQEKFVQKLGCRYIQGFYYYKPLPIKKFEELLRDKNQIAVSTSMFINERLGVIEGELGNVDDDISSFKSEHLLPDVQKIPKIRIKTLQRSPPLMQQPPHTGLQTIPASTSGSHQA